MEQLLTAGAEALRKAALNEDAKAYVLNNEALYKLMKKAADRYIGGENLTETLKKVQTSNDEGFKCSIEYMGESTRSVQEATKATDEFLNICNAINQKKLNSTISLDLSHIGLEISENLCYENLSKICEIANDKEVIISAEGTERTDRILKLYQKGSKEFSIFPLRCRLTSIVPQMILRPCARKGDVSGSSKEPLKQPKGYPCREDRNSMNGISIMSNSCFQEVTYVPSQRIITKFSRKLKNL